MWPATWWHFREALQPCSAKVWQIIDQLYLQSKIWFFLFKSNFIKIARSFLITVNFWFYLSKQEFLWMQFLFFKIYLYCHSVHGKIGAIKVIKPSSHIKEKHVLFLHHEPIESTIEYLYVHKPFSGWVSRFSQDF